MIRSSKLLFFTGLVSLASFALMANTTTHKFKDRVYKDSDFSRNQGWFMGAGVGDGWLKVSSSTQYVSYAPYDYVDSYTTKQTVMTNPIPSVEGGYRWRSSDQLPLMYFVGLRYRYYRDNLKGNTLVLNDPAFPYGFNYDISAQALSLFAKIDLIKWGRFAPYVTAGIGGASLRFSSYSEYPETDVSITKVSSAFASKSTFNFIYDLGVGLDYYLTNSWLISLGYDYVNVGKLKTGSGAYNTFTGTTSSLNLGIVQANIIFLQANYLFNA